METADVFTEFEKKEVTRDLSQNAVGTVHWKYMGGKEVATFQEIGLCREEPELVTREHYGAKGAPSFFFFSFFFKDEIDQFWHIEHAREERQ